MRLLFLLCSPLLALDYTMTLTPESDATGTVQTHAVHFDCGGPGGAGSLPPGKWPAPYVGGTKLATWQVDQESWCANGSLESAVISYVYGGNTVQFRADDNPCSSGNRAACDSAGLNQAGMLAFNGGTWTASAVFTASPQGSSSTATFDARARVAAGDWAYVLRGPAITQVLAGQTTTARTNSFGWKQHHIATLTASIPDGNATTIAVNDAAQWAGLSRPFEISIGQGNVSPYFELILICHVSGNTLYVGNSNGTDASCANTSGRGASGTTAMYHALAQDGTLVILRDSNRILTSELVTRATSFGVSDAADITAATLLQVGSEVIRVCNKSGNTLTVGTGSWPCTASDAGRNWHGTNYGFGDGAHYWNLGTPVRVLSALTDRWRDPPSDQFRSLQPDALLSFPAGWAGVNVQFRVRSGWMDRLQNQQYSVSINSGAYVRNDVIQAARQWVHFPVYNPATPGLRGLWVGTAPPTVKYDFNVRWCVSVGLCTDDPDLAVTEANLSTFLNNPYNSSTGDAPAWTSGNNTKCEADTVAIFDGAHRSYYGPFTRETNAPGARVDIGLKAKAQGLDSHSWRIAGSVATQMREMGGSLAMCTGLMPLHYLEHRNSLAFCDGGAYAANTSDKACTTAETQAVTTFGLPPSVVAYPDLNPGYQNNSPNKMRAIGAVSQNGMLAFIPGAFSHMHAASFWDLIASGNYYVRDLVISHGGNVAANGNAYSFSSASGTDGLRATQRGPFGLYYDGDGARSRAWQMRDTYFAWYAARSGSALKSYFGWVLARNIAALEGAFNWAGGSYYIPCQAGASQSNLADITYSPWCFGRMTRGMNGTMLDMWPSEFAKVPGVTSYANGLRAVNVHGTFMQHYENMTYAAMAGKFHGAIPLSREYTGRIFVARGLGTNIWGISAFQSPNTTCNPEGVDVANCNTQQPTIGMTQGFSTPASFYAAAGSSYTSWTAPDTSSGTQSRAMMAHALIRLEPRARYQNYTMARLREVFQFAKPTDLTGDPTWTARTWERPPVTVTPGDTSARITSSTLWPACKVAVQSTPFGIMDDSTHSAGAMIGQRLEHIVTGLTASTTYYYMVTCGDIGRTMGTFATTASAGGAVTKTIALAPPPNRGIATARIAYGSSASLGSTTASVSCATTCSIDVPAQTGRGLHWRPEYLDGSSNLVARGFINTDIP